MGALGRQRPTNLGSVGVGGASPTIHIKHEQGGVTACIEKFWQNFPKGIEVNNHGLFLHLFPQDYPDLFELQGGERKSHKLYMDFSGKQNALNWVESKIIAQLPLSWYAQANAFPYLTDKHNDENIDMNVNDDEDDDTNVNN